MPRSPSEPITVLVPGQGVIAGTTVATEAGERDITEIKVGDRVYAKQGLTKVTAVSCTVAPRRGGGEAPILTAAFSDGRTLSGTAGVRVWAHDHRRALGTWGGAYIDLGALGAGIAVLCWPEAFRRGQMAPYLRYPPLPYRPTDEPNLITADRVRESASAEGEGEIPVYAVATVSGEVFYNGCLCAAG